MAKKKVNSPKVNFEMAKELNEEYQKLFLKHIELQNKYTQTLNKFINFLNDVNENYVRIDNKQQKPNMKAVK